MTLVRKWSMRTRVLSYRIVCVSSRTPLRSSETVQRFFFGMGTNYPLRLAYFFDPALLETRVDHLEEDDENEAGERRICHGMRDKVVCAVRPCLSTLWPHRSIRQMHLTRSSWGVTLQGLIPAAAYCLARNGPASMVQESLELLERMVHGNEGVANSFSEAIVKATVPIPGRSVPQSLAGSLPQLTYGYRGTSLDPSGTDEHIEVTCISVPCLIAERFIHSPTLWSHDSQAVDIDLSTRALSVLEKLTSPPAVQCALLPSSTS